MSCLSPLHGVRYIDESTGEFKVQIVGKAAGSKEWLDESCDTFVKGWHILIPCGKCIGCKLDHAKQFADRCFLESLCHKNNWFVTLTYNDLSVPRNKEGVMSCRKDDMSMFLKRLRSRIAPDRIRFYGCCEYGSTTYRPHMHLILFGVPDYLVEETRGNFRDKKGNVFFESPTLQDCWSFDDVDLYNGDYIRRPYGYVSVANANYQTMAYVARYVSKKSWQTDLSEVYDIEPASVNMSRRPGIGKPWYDANGYKPGDSYYFALPDGHKVLHSIKYYEKIYDKESQENHDYVEELKDRRIKESYDRMRAQQHQTDLDYFTEYLPMREDKLKKIDKSIERDLRSLK